jgi:predicted ArsR family transcriptional regulator
MSTAVDYRTRALILAELDRGPVPMADLARRLDVPIDQVRDDLRRLRDAGHVRPSGTGWRLRRTYRPAQDQEHRP